MSEDDRFEYIRRHGSAPPEHPKEEGLNDITEFPGGGMVPPPSAGGTVDTGLILTTPEQRRIEALRAAAQVVAGLKLQVVYSDQDTEALTLRMAKRFERYLESGE